MCFSNNAYRRSLTKCDCVLCIFAFRIVYFHYGRQVYVGEIQKVFTLNGSKTPKNTICRIPGASQSQQVTVHAGPQIKKHIQHADGFQLCPEILFDFVTLNHLHKHLFKGRSTNEERMMDAELLVSPEIANFSMWFSFLF